MDGGVLAGRFQRMLELTGSRDLGGSDLAQRRSDETSAVHVSGQHQCRDADGVVRRELLHVGRSVEKVGPRQTL